MDNIVAVNLFTTTDTIYRLRILTGNEIIPCDECPNYDIAYYVISEDNSPLKYFLCSNCTEDTLDIGHFMENPPTECGKFIPIDTSMRPDTDRGEVNVCSNPFIHGTEEYNDTNSPIIYDGCSGNTLNDLENALCHKCNNAKFTHAAERQLLCGYCVTTFYLEKADFP